MGRWMEQAARLEQEEIPCAVNVISANSPAFDGLRAPNGTKDTNGTGNSSPSVAAWRNALSRLNPSSPPVQLSPERWRRMIEDAGRFLTGWGDQAVALGWSELDLFGVSPRFARRLDRDGVIYALEGRAVLAITADAATIDQGSAKPTRYYRTEKRGAVVWWSAVHSAGL